MRERLGDAARHQTGTDFVTSELGSNRRIERASIGLAQPSGRGLGPLYPQRRDVRFVPKADISRLWKMTHAPSG
jgi:hypothetical protein